MFCSCLGAGWLFPASEAMISRYAASRKAFALTSDPASVSVHN